MLKKTKSSREFLKFPKISKVAEKLKSILFPGLSKSLEDAINKSKSIVSQKPVKITPLCHDRFQNAVKITQLCQFHRLPFDPWRVRTSILASSCSLEQKIIIIYSQPRYLEHVIEVFQSTRYFHWRNENHIGKSQIGLKFSKLDLIFRKSPWNMDRIFLEVRNCKGDNLCFIERPRSFIHSSLLLVRVELDAEVGDLLRRGFPVSRKQEQDLKLNTCIRTISPNNGDKDTCDVSYDYCLEIKEFMIKDNMAATNITPPRARKDRSLITEAGTSIMQTGIDERLESRAVEKSIAQISEDKLVVSLLTGLPGLYSRPKELTAACLNILKERGQSPNLSSIFEMSLQIFGNNRKCPNMENKNSLC